MRFNINLYYEKGDIFFILMYKLILFKKQFLRIYLGFHAQKLILQLFQ